jgi:polysaccharide pyruvyl transferase WcaK-like protein
MSSLSPAPTIHVLPSTFDCSNVGDVAMLKTTLSRLRDLWPQASLAVPTGDSLALHRHCPDAVAVCQPRSLPRNPASRWPRVLRRLGVRHGAGRSGQIGAATRVVLASGAGGINDVFPSYARLVLASLEEGIERGLPTALFSQGLGPLSDPGLLSTARRVLPRVDLIALRERRTGPALLETIGVEPQRVRVTGDDAVSLAHERRPRVPGASLGINLRVSWNAEVDEADVAALRPVLHAFARQVDAPLLPLPIARKKGVDTLTLRSLLETAEGTDGGGGEALDTPEAVIEQASRCRVVVTGAYHAAVFALSQGIPAICLFRSAYFAGKFLGLQELFGEGCEVLAMEADWPSRLSARLAAIWENAPAWRESLLESAARQAAASRRAYGELRAIVEARYA